MHVQAPELLCSALYSIVHTAEVARYTVLSMLEEQGRKNKPSRDSGKTFM